jgi:uncharacterized protein (TIGR02611 family)
MAMFLVKTIKQVKKLMIAVIGFTVLAIGLALIVLPGPAVLVIPAGLAILSIEFAWARNLLKQMKEKLSRKHGTTHSDNTIDRQEL